MPKEYDEYKEITVKAMAYDLMLIFNKKRNDAVYTPEEIEHIIIDYVNKTYRKNKVTAGNRLKAVPVITILDVLRQIISMNCAIICLEVL